jgi:GLPGLI family protein
MLSAQKQMFIEQAILEVHYYKTMQQDTIRKNKIETDSMILRIGNDVSQFYSYHTFFYDSIWNDPSGRKKAEELSLEAFRSQDFSKKPGVRTTHNYIYKNYPQNKKMSITTNRLVAGFIYEDDYKQQEWTILDSTKQILNHKCKLAVCQFRGREWFAWYTQDILFGDGPWKLNGLPGLILEAYDKSRSYFYLASQIIEKDLEPIYFYNFYEKEFIPTDRTTYLGAKYDFISGVDPDKIDLINDLYWDGKKVNYLGRTPRRLLYDFQETDYK